MRLSKKAKKDCSEKAENSADLSTLHSILAPLAPSDTISQMFERVIERVLAATGADAGLIRVLDKETRSLPCACQRGFPEQYLKLADALSRASASGRVFTTGEPIISPEIASDSRSQGKVQLKVGFRSCAILPLYVSDKVRGIIHLASHRTGYFNEQKRELLMAVARQMGIALENHELFHEVDRRRKHSEALREIGLSLTVTHDPQQVLERVAEEARQLIGALFTFVVTPDTPYYKFAAVAGDDQGYRNVLKLSDKADSPYGQGPLGQAIRNRTPVICEDVLTDPLFATWREIASARGVRSLVAVPLLGQGKTYGALLTYSPVPRAYDTETLNLLNALAAQAAAALESARLFKETEKRAMELSALHTVMSAVSGSLELNEVLEKALHAVLLVTGMESGYIRLLEGVPPRLSVKSHKGISPSFLEHLQKGPGPGGKAEQVLSTKRSLVFEDIQNRYAGELVDPRREGSTAAAWIPIILKDSVGGIINVATREAGTFLREQIPLLESVAASLGVAIENARLYEKVRTKSEELAALIKVNRDLASLSDREILLQRIAGEARKILNVDGSAFRLVEGDSLVLVSGSDPQNLALRPRLHLNESLSGRVVQENRAIAIKNVFEDSTMIESHRAVMRNAGYHSFLGIPLRVGDRIIGTINFYCKEEREFQPDEISLVTAFADQAAVAVENANLYQRSRRGEEIQKLLKELSLDITSLDIDTLLKKLTEKVREFFAVDICDVRMIDNWLPIAVSGIEPERIRGSGTFHGRSKWVLENRRALAIADITKETDAPTRSSTRQIGIRGYLAVPLFSRGGEVVGILRALTYQPREYTQEEVDLLQQLANGAAIALENTRLFKETEKRAQEQAALNSIAMAVNQSLHLDELLQISLNKVLDVTGREGGYIRLKDPVTGELRLAAHRGISQDYVETLLHHRTPGGKSEQVFQSGEPLIVNDPEGTLLKEETRREGSRSIAWIPLKARGKVVGILNISTNHPIPFGDREVNLLLTIGNVIGVALENAQLFEDSERLVRELEASTDQLSAKNRELDSFVYTVSHDLKAPLISLEGMAALLLDEYAGKLDEGAQHYLKRLMAGSKQMETLILDLLTLSRIGREGRPPEGVPLNQIVDDLILEWGETIRERKIRVTRQDLPTLWGVPTQIQQVMTNLIGNAVKYLGAPADPMIEIGAKDGGEKIVECYVKDNGIGIDPQYHEKVFETFQRLKEIETEGTGVGLAIVKKIVEGAGGRIWVESTKGEGAVFRFTWPKRQTEVRS